MEASTLEHQAADVPVVRIGTPDDVDEMMRLALECHHENGFVKADTARMLNDVWAALTRDHGIAGVIGGLNGKPMEGCVLLRIGKVDYSDDDVLNERFLFVSQNYRREKIGRAKLLAEFAKMASESLDLPLLIGILSNHRTEAKVRLYKRVFGEPAGAFFLYNASTRLNWDKPQAEHKEG